MKKYQVIFYSSNSKTQAKKIYHNMLVDITMIKKIK